jgi:hypothetical protein
MILAPYTIDGDSPYIQLLADLLVRDVCIGQQQNTGAGDGPGWFFTLSYILT